MQRMIPVDKLARPEDHILLPATRTRNARTEQGLSPGNAMPYEDDFLKSRMHGICGGEFQAMEAAGPRFTIFLTRRGSSNSTWRARCGTKRGTPRSI